MSEPPRRSKRALATVEPDLPAALTTTEDVDEEEEVTRCLCGQQDYPGPPLSPVFTTEDAQSDDAGNWFISCDGCHVWQHGGCVGLADESQSPEKYFCEECRPKHHEVRVDSRGQRFSLYLPVTSRIAARKNSISSRSDERARKERAEISRGSIDPLSGKRRGTIRSREHDHEAEQIQRAIEESKRDVEGDGKSSKSSNGTKKSGKRSRDDSSEDVKQDTKRQRRGSEIYPSALRNSEAIEDDSDDDGENNNPASRAKKARADAVQTVRQAEQREKEKERERARAEAAGRRQQRAGRRRADDGEDETPNPTRASPRASSQPESPPPPPPQPEKVSHKKGAGSKRVKRLGNNQYTKNRGETSAPASSPHNRKRLLAHNNTDSVASSGDEAAMPSGSTSTPVGDGSNGHTSKPAVPKASKFLKGKKAAAAAAAALTGTATSGAATVELSLDDMLRILEERRRTDARDRFEIDQDRARCGFASPPGERAGWEAVDNINGDLVKIINAGPPVGDETVEEKLLSLDLSEHMWELIRRKTKISA